MDHPSMYEPGDDDDDGKLPDWATDEQMKALLTDIHDRLERVGLYMEEGVGVDPEGDQIFVFVALDIGQLAFVKRVQNPEQDKVDDAFHSFEADSVRDRFEEIRGKFIGKDPTDPKP